MLVASLERLNRLRAVIIFRPNMQTSMPNTYVDVTVICVSHPASVATTEKDAGGRGGRKLYFVCIVAVHVYIYTLHLFIDWYTFMCDGCRRRSKSDIQLPFIPIDANTVPRFFFVFYSGVLLFFFNAFSTALIAKYMR